jgi:hypothetical protein
MSDVEGDEPMAVDTPSAAGSGPMDINQAIQVLN